MIDHTKPVVLSAHESVLFPLIRGALILHSYCFEGWWCCSVVSSVAVWWCKGALVCVVVVVRDALLVGNGEGDIDYTIVRAST